MWESVVTVVCRYTEHRKTKKSTVAGCCIQRRQRDFVVIFSGVLARLCNWLLRRPITTADDAVSDWRQRSYCFSVPAYLRSTTRPAKLHLVAKINNWLIVAPPSGRGQYSSSYGTRGHWCRRRTNNRPTDYCFVIKLHSDSSFLPRRASRIEPNHSHVELFHDRRFHTANVIVQHPVQGKPIPCFVYHFFDASRIFFLYIRLYLPYRPRLCRIKKTRIQRERFALNV